MAGNANHILIDGRRLRDALPFERAFDLKDTIPESGGFLKLLPGRGGVHLAAQFVYEFLVVPFQELTHLPDNAMVVRLRLLTGAGRHAAFDLKLDAGPLSRAVDVDA